jgi:hypothetical protein
VSDLRNELLLRLGKVLLAGLLGAVLYVVATSLGATAGPGLALEAFIAGGVLILILQSPPL